MPRIASDGVPQLVNLDEHMQVVSLKAPLNEWIYAIENMRKEGRYTDGIKNLIILNYIWRDAYKAF